MAADSYLLAVDIGTTFTAAAVLEPGGEPRVFPLGGSSALSAPSAVARSGDELVFGRAAVRRANAAPDAVALEFKRRMGDETPIILAGTPYGAEALTGALLGWVVGRVSEEMGGPPSALVLAHPANWGLYKQDLLRESSRLAGFPDPVFVPEPVAAAAHYAQAERIEVGERVAVYDLGGGTFDTAVIERTTSGFEILGEPHGMDRFGGIDLDFAILTHIRQTVGESLDALDPSEPETRAALQRLAEEARLAKEALSEDTEVSVPVALPGLHTHIRVTREEFEDAIRPRVRDTIEAVRRAIDSTGLSVEDVSRILLVGGASRVPLVADTVRSGLGRPVALDANPKHSVCLGAAVTGSAPSFAVAAAPRRRDKPAIWTRGVAALRRPAVALATLAGIVAFGTAGWALMSAGDAGPSGPDPTSTTAPQAAASLTTTTTIGVTSSTADVTEDTSIPTTTARPTTTTAAPTTTAARTATTVAPTTTAAPTPTTAAPPTTTTQPSTTTTQPSTTTTAAQSTAVVPSLVGKTRTEAIAALEALNLGYEEDRSCFGGVTDLVVYQSPEAGYVMLTGGGPDKTVYFGSEFRTGCSNVTVNSVVGLTRTSAIGSLEGNGFVVSVNEGCHGGSSPGVVVAQSPEGGATAPQGWTVTINVQASGCG